MTSTTSSITSLFGSRAERRELERRAGDRAAAPESIAAIWYTVTIPIALTIMNSC
jgi:hypothetical protein